MNTVASSVYRNQAATRDFGFMRHLQKTGEKLCILLIAAGKRIELPK